jgi:ankyrin repeat protein
MTTGLAEGAMDEGKFTELCRTGTPQAVKAAIVGGGDVKGRDWGPPLAAAADNPNVQVFSVLLAHGAKVSPELLVNVAGKEHPKKKEAFAILLKDGGDINATFGENGLKRSPLLSAAGAKIPDLKFIAYLLENGANVNARVEEDPDYETSDGPPDRIESGWTALMYAAGAVSPDPAFVDLLLKNGADVNPKDVYMGTTPLMAALSNRYHATPWTARSPRLVNMEVVALLLKSGAEVNARDEDGVTPLSYAADNSAEAVSLLLKNGADVNARSENGSTPLMSAVEGNYIPNAEDGGFGSNLEMVRLMLESGAEVDAKDDLGRTALMFAAEGRYGPESRSGVSDPDLVSLLLEKGANAQLTDNEGKTALGYAAENLKDTDVYKLLGEPITGNS